MTKVSQKPISIISGTVLMAVLSVLIISSTPNSFAATNVFSTDFNSGIPSEFSGSTSEESVHGYDGLGTGSNVFSGNFLRNSAPTTITTLTLTDLPPHDSVNIGFLLAIIDSWDCDSSSGPDFFNVKVDGNIIFSENFGNSGGACSDPFSPSPGVQLAFQQDLGFTPIDTYYADSAYDMGLEPVFQNIPHTSSSITIEWFGTGLQAVDDESWAIDNVSITTNPKANLVVNGSFEEPELSSGSFSIFETITGWESTNGIEIQNNVAGAPEPGAGEQFVELDVSGNSSIFQNISTIEGGCYKISFLYSPRPGVSESSNTIIVSWNSRFVG